MCPGPSKGQGVGRRWEMAAEEGQHLRTRVSVRVRVRGIRYRV